MLTSCDKEQAGSLVRGRRGSRVRSPPSTPPSTCGWAAARAAMASRFATARSRRLRRRRRPRRPLRRRHQGLCVRFATRDGATPAQQSVELVRDGKVVRSVDVAVAPPTREAGGAPHATAVVDGHVDTLRTDGWVPVEVEVTPSFGLTATFNGRRFFGRQRLDGWGGESRRQARPGRAWAAGRRLGATTLGRVGPKADRRCGRRAHVELDRPSRSTRLRLRLGALVDASDAAA